MTFLQSNKCLYFELTINACTLERDGSKRKREKQKEKEGERMYKKIIP